MKKPLKTPLIVGSLVLAVALLSFIVWKGASGPSEFEKPKITGGLPDYVKSRMTPAQLEQMRKDGVNVDGPAGQPTTPVKAKPGG